jgi:aldose 1-epimerase
MSLRINNQIFSLELEPSIGGAVSRFAWLRDGGDIELLRRAKGKTILDMSMFPMLPYCGRIRDNQFQVGDKTYYLKSNFLSEPLACHGDGWIHPWEVLEVSKSMAVLGLASANSPYTFQAWQTFELLDTGLKATLRIVNQASEVMPFGLGFHPYFDKPNTTLQMNTAWVWLEGLHHLPSEYLTTPPELSFQTPRVLPKVWRNMCYSGWDGRANLNLSTVDIQLTSSGRHLQLYTPPDTDYFCLEPQSHCVNAFNLIEEPPFDTGKQWLASGQEMIFEMVLQIID